MSRILLEMHQSDFSRPITIFCVHWGLSVINFFDEIEGWEETMSGFCDRDCSI